MDIFPHLYTARQGLLNAMTNEQNIPVEGFFPMGATQVTLVLWGSPGCPAVLEAFDKNGKSVDKVSVRRCRASRRAIRLPILLTVKGEEIVYIRYSGSRTGEWLVADEVRFVPMKVAPTLPKNAGVGGVPAAAGKCAAGMAGSGGGGLARRTDDDGGQKRDGIKRKLPQAGEGLRQFSYARGRGIAFKPTYYPLFSPSLGSRPGTEELVGRMKNAAGFCGVWKIGVLGGFFWQGRAVEGWGWGCGLGVTEVL